MLSLYRRKKIANFEKKILIEEKEILWPNCGGIQKVKMILLGNSEFLQSKNEGEISKCYCGGNSQLLL